MTGPLQPSDLMTKAERACASAQLLIDSGDVDGACNRAYYAMFDAARAALLASNPQASSDIARTHGGLISAFSVHLVKPGIVSPDLGRALNRAEEIRLVADYLGESIEPDAARMLVKQAAAFVAAMRQVLSPSTGPSA